MEGEKKPEPKPVSDTFPAATPILGSRSRLSPENWNIKEWDLAINTQHACVTGAGSGIVALIQ